MINMTETQSPLSTFTLKQELATKKARIKCVGVGGCGGNIIDHLAEEHIQDVQFIAVNTDAQDLKDNKAHWVVQVGKDGLGAGGDPEQGRLSAEESLPELEDAVTDTDLLFITAGMGGGTGTGVAPVLARIAKEKYKDNILVIGVVTRPFSYEGPKKEKYAQEGIEELQKYADCTLIIPNQRIFDIIDKNTSTEEAYSKVDEVLVRAVKGISEVIIKPGKRNIDYNDLRKIMLHSGHALIGIGEASGKDRHLVAMEQALNSPLLENKNIMGAKGLLVSFTAPGDFPMKEEQDVMNYVKRFTSSTASIKHGVIYDSTMDKDSLKVVVIAANFPNNGVIYDSTMDKDSLKVVVIAANFPNNVENLIKQDDLKQSEAEKRWIPLDYMRFIPAKKWHNQEVK